MEFLFFQSVEIKNLCTNAYEIDMFGLTSLQESEW